MPGGALEVIAAGALDGVAPGLRAALRPVASTSARSGCASGPITGAADSLDVRLHRPRRAHLPPAPDRGPDLRARQAGHRAAGACSSRRLDPRAGASVVWGSVARRLGRRTSSRPRARSRARCACSTRSPGTTPRTSSASWSRRSSRRTASSAEVDLRPRRPAGGQRAGGDRHARARRSRPVRRRRRSASPRAQSLGGEDFAWYLETVPGAMAPARHPHARRSDVRPAPGRPAGRRAGRRVGAKVLRRGALAVFARLDAALGPITNRSRTRPLNVGDRSRS